MSTLGILIAALAKIVFILLVVVGAFAPMLVWAERRQSAMMQDRLGPQRAGIPLPQSIVSLLDAARPTLSQAAWLCGFATIIDALIFGGAQVFGADALLGVPTVYFGYATAFFAVLFVLLKIGYWVHTTIVHNKGNIALLGLLHPLADAIKFIFKEDFVPPKADKLLHALSPIISLIPAVAVFAVIPFGATLYLGMWNQVYDPTLLAEHTAVPLQVASLNVGILFIFAIAGTGVVGAAIGGYASDNKFSLIGGVRAASQMVSYEVALGLTLVPAFMWYGSVRLEEMAAWQYAHRWGIFCVPLIPAFVMFFTAAIAETKRVPFDLPEGESELVGGYLTEYSGMKFGMFFMSEFVEVVALSAVAALLFFGGWDVPFLYHEGIRITLFGSTYFAVDLPHVAVVAIQVGAFLGKIVAFIWFQLLIRWSLPRFRYDQLMSLCWKGLLPLSLLNILFTGMWILLWG